MSPPANPPHDPTSLPVNSGEGIGSLLDHMRQTGKDGASILPFGLARVGDGMPWWLPVVTMAYGEASALDPLKESTMTKACLCDDGGRMLLVAYLKGVRQQRHFLDSLVNLGFEVSSRSNPGMASACDFTVRPPAAAQ